MELIIEVCLRREMRKELLVRRNQISFQSVAIFPCLGAQHKFRVEPGRSFGKICQTLRESYVPLLNGSRHSFAKIAILYTIC